jgi:very-short-patch-repair endonuclease
VGRERNHGIEGRGTDGALARVATRQGGPVSLEQLVDAGISGDAAAKRAKRGSLHRVHRGVYTVGHRSISRAGALRAAVLACGEAAVVSHGTTAAFWGLQDKWPALTDVTVPNQRGRKIEGVRCRRCRYPTPEEIVVAHGVRCTTPARTLVDMAGMLGTPSLRRLVERAAVVKRLDLQALDRALHEARGRRGVKALARIADEWRTEDGAVPDVRSDFEALVLPRLLTRGLPRPRCNETLALGGERLMVDFLWPAHRLVVETDGRETHETPVAFQRDRRRDQLLLAAGYRVGRATWAQIHGELEAVVERVASALVAAGRED